jgi:hypothetical protein
MGEYQAGEQRVRFWLEWDRATMGTRDLVAKFRTYAHYMTSHEWFKEQRVIPHLLVVVPGKEQEMRIARIVEDVRVNTPGLVILTTTATRLKDSGPLAQIWYQEGAFSPHHSHILHRSLSPERSQIRLLCSGYLAPSCGRFTLNLTQRIPLSLTNVNAIMIVALPQKK